MTPPSVSSSGDFNAGSGEPPFVADHALERRIGQGSYGEVWLSRSMTGAWRAVKVVYNLVEGAGGFKRELAAIRKFEPISRTTSGLVHILQVGQDSTRSFFYYVMELADDGSREEPWSAGHATALRGEINEATYVPRTLGFEKRRRGRLPAHECLEIAAGLADALANLHEQGLLHRDLKPSNIIFVRGVPKLADIGLIAEMSEANSYVGTEGYIAPEGPNSPGGDIYSLGKVLYEISTGKDRQDFPEPMTTVEEGERELFKELNAIILKAAHPDAAARYRSAREMHRDLLLLRGGTSILQRSSARARIKWMALSAGAVALFATAAILVDRTLALRLSAIQGQSTLIKPALIGKVQPREPSAPRDTVDLSAYYTAPLVEAWYPGPKENSLASLPRGVQKFDHVSFDVRGLVQLAGREISAYQPTEVYPRQMRRIPLDRWSKRLHFLHGAVSEVADGKRIGTYQVEFASGRTVEIPIIYGRDLRALWQPDQADGIATNAVLVWNGQNPATRERNMSLRLYKDTWENPWPNEQLVHLDFSTTMGNSAPFLVALTCDEHEPPAGQKQIPLHLAAALQQQATNFQKIEPLAVPGRGEAEPLRLNEHAIKIGTDYVDGIRFNVPVSQVLDFAWFFSDSTNRALHRWSILPMSGRMKVGFEDWYHGVGEGSEPAVASPELQLQFLAGKKLQPGREYFIWFNFPDSKPVDLKILARFAPTGEMNPNQPETIARALGVDRVVAAGHTKFHRHYCLGGVR